MSAPQFRKAAGQRWEASDIPLVVGAVIVTRLLRVAVECFARELALEAAGTFARARRRDRNDWTSPAGQA